MLKTTKNNFSFKKDEMLNLILWLFLWRVYSLTISMSMKNNKIFFVSYEKYPTFIL